MRSLIIPPNVITAVSLSLLSACNNFSPNLRPAKENINLHSDNHLSQLQLKSSLRSTYSLALADIKKLKRLPQGQKMASVYWKIISQDPWPVKVTCLNSVINSQTFVESSSTEKLRLLEIMKPAFTADTALIFKECFASVKCRTTLHSPDFMGKKMLDSLHALATQPVDPVLELQRGEMITDLFKYICGLEALDQSTKKVCGPVACLIALGNKAEIVRLVQGLSSKQAQVRLASGATMQRCSSAITDDTDIHISPAIRLLASSVLEHSNGKIFSYSSNLDINSMGPVIFSGMLPGWCLHAMNDLTGKQHTALNGQAASVTNMIKSLNNHAEYAVVLRISSPLHWHWIVVRRIEGEWAYFQDPTGQPPKTQVNYPKTIQAEENLDKPQNQTHKKVDRPALNISQFFAQQSRQNFTAYSWGLPENATYKVSLSDLAQCAKVIIVPADSIK